ncbi:hypothetical protein VPHD148_0013 [Vibrio phage D148]
MARVGNTVNLEGNSRYDILTYDFPEGYPTGMIALGFGKTPKRISGIEKVSQVFLKTLMTYNGSDVVYTTRGTDFPSFTGARNLQATDLTEISADIRDAITEAEAQTKSILNVSTEGLTSQLDYVQVINVDQFEDSTTINVRLITKAGETAPIALPFTSLGLEVNS